jgi:Holliday junction resolvase RusA-like endonuclease
MYNISIIGDMPSINSKYGLNTRTKKLYLNPKYREYKNRVSAMFKSKYPLQVPYEGNVYVKIFMRTKKDIDNVIKPTLDGLNGYAYVDDKQIIKLEVERLPYIDVEGITVGITEVE